MTIFPFENREARLFVSKSLDGSGQSLRIRLYGSEVETL